MYIFFKQYCLDCFFILICRCLLIQTKSIWFLGSGISVETIEVNKPTLVYSFVFTNQGDNKNNYKVKVVYANI